jgi:hypothetical protein
MRSCVETESLPIKTEFDKFDFNTRNLNCDTILGKCDAI